MTKTGKAERTYVMWHQKNPTKVHKVDVPLPKLVACVGAADCITYVSDKWEEDGDVHDYVHEFDSSPSVYMVDDDGDVELVVEGEHALPILGVVRELIFLPTGAEKKHVLRFRTLPIMCCTTDKKTVVIFAEKTGPIFIHGGKMHITERGIHR